MKSLSELKAISDKAQAQLALDEKNSSFMRVCVGLATCGIASGAKPVMETLKKLVEEKNLDNVLVTQVGCIGLCQYEPIVEIHQPGKDKVTYIRMDAEKAKEVFEQHIERGLIVSKYTLETTEL